MTKKRNHIPKTNWYKGTQKPVRTGAYKRLYLNGVTLFCWFDSKSGKFGHGMETPNSARGAYKIFGHSAKQNLAWCGLSRDPAEVAK